MPYRSGEMAPLLNHAAARAVICGPASQHYDAPAVMLELQDRIETLQHVVVVGHTAPVGTVSLYDLIDGGSTRNIGNPPVASDPAILCFTSGTSSAPKAVVHNYHTMLSNNRVCADLYGITSDDVLLSAPPFTHAFGVCIINFALMSGATHLLMPLFTPDALAEAIASDRPTLLFVAPAHVAACLNSGAFDTCDLSSVRLATISGSACPYELAKAMDDRLCNGRVGQMWGMTETFMGLLTPFDASADLRYGTLGYPTPAVELRMVTTDGTDCGPGEEGEIQVRGCSVIPAYFDNEQANRQSFTADGWFKTGDLGVADENGIVVITGRVKDIINRGGIKINPLDIEALIDQHPSVMQSAMAPMPDPTLGERACLFVTLVPGTELSLDEVCAYLAENQVAKMRWPERLEIIDAMPMTPTRKIIKAALVRLIG